MSQVTSLSPPPPIEVTDEAANWGHFALAASPSSTLVEPSETAEDATTNDPASPAQIFDPVVDDEDTAAVSPGAIEGVVSVSEDIADEFDDASDEDEENLYSPSAPVTASNDGPLAVEPVDQVQLTVRAVKDWYWTIRIPKPNVNRKGKAKLQDTTNQVHSIAQSSKRRQKKNTQQDEDEDNEENQDAGQAEEVAAARRALMVTLEKTKMKTMPLGASSTAWMH
ncbi:hypothetical protein BKA62DRAFT_719795 [Auriculariales sp. MPI-PUGE-AT-0066]|nr:hypothetical protein BKA62DRAFT_719795 [Auriculariales sp. MPI-PUGE-AT-0066]